MPSRTTTTTEADTRPLIARARAAVPGFTEAEAALSRLDAHLRALPTGQDDALTEVGPDVLDDVLDGAPLAELALGARAAALVVERDTAQAERLALGRLREALVATQVERVADGADAGLAVIRAELDTVLAAARRDLAALDGIDSADAAIDAGRAAEWRAFREHATRYSHVRNAQSALVREVLHTADLVAPSTDTAGTGTLVDRERRALVGVYGHVANATELVELTAAHRSGADRELPWLAPEPTAALAYVLDSRAEPWLPNMAELIAARTAHDAALHAPLAEDRTQIGRHTPSQLAAHRRGFGMTGGDDVQRDYDRNRI